MMSLAVATTRALGAVDRFQAAQLAADIHNISQGEKAGQTPAGPWRAALAGLADAAPDLARAESRAASEDGFGGESGAVSGAESSSGASDAQGRAYLAGRSFLDAERILGASPALADDPDRAEALRRGGHEAAALCERSATALDSRLRLDLDRLIAGHALTLPLALYLRFLDINQMMDALYDQAQMRQLTWIALIGAVGVVLLGLGYVSYTGDGVSRFSASGLYGVITGMILYAAYERFRRNRLRRELAALGAEIGLPLRQMRPSRVTIILRKLGEHLAALGLDVDAMDREQIGSRAAEIDAHLARLGPRWGLEIQPGLRPLTPESSERDGGGARPGPAVAAPAGAGSEA